MDLLEFTPSRAHLLLAGVFGDHPHNNNTAHLDRGVLDDAVLQRHWCLMAAQSASWYSTPQGVLGHRFMDLLAEEWRGVLKRSCNSDRPLVFAHVILTNTLGILRAREI